MLSDNNDDDIWNGLFFTDSGGVGWGEEEEKKDTITKQEAVRAEMNRILYAWYIKLLFWPWSKYLWHVFSRQVHHCHHVPVCMADQNHDDILHAYYTCVVGTVKCWKTEVLWNLLVSHNKGELQEVVFQFALKSLTKTVCMWYLTVKPQAFLIFSFRFLKERKTDCKDRL